MRKKIITNQYSENALLNGTCDIVVQKNYTRYNAIQFFCGKKDRLTNIADDFTVAVFRIKLKNKFTISKNNKPLREIKFRAWDTEMKQWVIIGFHVFGETTIFGMIQQHCAENNLGKPTLDRLLNDVQVTEYTGLKDKNGKEIYEGDILGMSSLNKKTIGEVKYSPGLFVFRFFSLQENGGVEFGSIPLDGVLRKFQVDIIGNIYQNPELLKQ